MTSARPPGRSTRSTSDTQFARLPDVSVGSRSRMTATSKLPASYGHMPHGARVTSTSAPSASMAASPFLTAASSASTAQAVPVRPALPARTATSARSRTPTARNRFPSLTPAMVTAKGSPGADLRNNPILLVTSKSPNLQISKSPHFQISTFPSFQIPSDIVVGCENSPTHRESRRQTRHHAGRPGRRQHDDHRRRDRHPPRPRQTDRIAHADGYDPAGQADRSQFTEDQGLRAPRLPRRRRVRRLGPVRRELLRGRQDGRCPRQGAARSDQARARTDPPLARGVRPPLREAAGLAP